MYALLLLNLILPFVLYLVGYILKQKPVTDMSSQNGYNTPTSRKSQEHWDYAQSIAPDIFMSLGMVLVVVEAVISIASFLLQIKVMLGVAIGMCVGFGFMFFGFYTTDKKIEEKFGR
ncbi:MAG: SdpI family protein [Lachnospiraceae bacterium]|nr:SdpI family protein [Lachnospiraceae bacterium]